MSRIDKALYQNGLRFECTGCGACCKARHGYGYIYVSLPERRRLARHLGLSTGAFTRRHCGKTDGRFHLRDPSNDCHFLDGNRCKVYSARPEQCRSWPFWPENMNARVWNREVKRDCPGIGRGPLHSAGRIERVLARDAARQERS